VTNSYKLFLNLGFRNLGTLLFDHEAVFIDFKTDKKKSKMFINRTIINNPRTADEVAAAAADTYLAHATPGQPDPREGPQYVFHIQSPKIIMTGLKLIPLTFSFELDPWGQLYDVLPCIGMLQA
jgi:hypothetical protein